MSALATLTHPFDADRSDPSTPPSPGLTITVVPDGAEVTLQLDGELDLTTAGTFRACLDHVDPSCRAVTLDLSRLSFIDSTGVGLFVQAHREASVAMRTMTVVHPSDRVRFVFDLTGLGELLY